MRTIIILVGAICFLLIGCSKSPIESTPVLLRIENAGIIAFDSVVVINPAGRQSYFNVGNNSKSDYKEFEFIYNYAYVKAYYGNQSAIFQPIDYVGETKLTSGKFTYKIVVVSNLTSNRILLENKKD